MIEWCRVGNYVPSVCDRSREIANVFQILIKQKFTLTTTGMSSIWNRNSEFPQKKKKNSDIISNHVFIQEYNKNKVATRWFESLFTKRHISGELCLMVELESDCTVCVICQSSFTIMSENDCNQSERDWDCLETGCLLSLISSCDRKWSPTVQPSMARRSTSHFYSSVTDLSGHQKRTIRPILLFIHVSLILNGQWL